MSQNWSTRREESPRSRKSRAAGSKYARVKPAGTGGGSQGSMKGPSRDNRNPAASKKGSNPAKETGRAGGDRNLMQDLKPTVWIGKQGCTETIVAEVTAQLKTRKTVKVKWLKNTEVIPEDLARSTGARLIGVRGHTMVLEERRKL